MALPLRTALILATLAAPATLFACGSGGAGGAGTTTTTSAGGASTTSTSTISATLTTNACADTADTTAIATTHACTFASDFESCTLQNIQGGADGVASCLVSTDGLSASCAVCFGALGECFATSCLATCSDAGVDGPACQTCLQTNCGAAFASCSGLTGLTPGDAGACGSSGDAGTD